MKILDSHLQAREDERRRQALFTTNNPPHLLSHFAVSFTSFDSTVDPGIESRSAILWLCYLVPLPPPFAASDEIHRFYFRRWVRFRCRCLCTPCCGSTRRQMFRRTGNDGGGVAFYASAWVSSEGGGLTPPFASANHPQNRISTAYTRRGCYELPQSHAPLLRNAAHISR